MTQWFAHMGSLVAQPRADVELLLAALAAALL